MIDPITLMMAANTAQTGLGIFQGVKANKLAQGLQRPDYEIPEEVYQNLDQATIQMLEGLPADQKQAYLDNIERGTQTGLRNISSRKGPGFERVLQMDQDAQKGLFAEDVAQRQKNIAEAMAQKQNLANYKDKKWSDQLSVYEDKAANVKDLTGAAIENIFGGIQQGVSQYADYKLYKDLLGLKPTTQPTSQTGLPTVDVVKDLELNKISPIKLDNPYAERGLSYADNTYKPGIYNFTKPSIDNKYNFNTGK